MNEKVLKALFHLLAEKDVINEMQFWNVSDAIDTGDDFKIAWAIEDVARSVAYEKRHASVNTAMLKPE